MLRRILMLAALLLCAVIVRADDTEEIGALPLPSPQVIAQIIVITPATVIDFQGLATSPGNPPTGKGRVYFNSATGQLTCLTSTGGSCAGGASPVAGSQISFGATVSPLAYGAKFDVKYTVQATFNVGNATVTCAASDCNFTSADVGKITFGFGSPSNSNIGTAAYVTALAQTTIATVNSSTSISAVATAANNCTPTNSGQECILAWGTQDDATAINNAATAAWSQSGANSTCKALEIPSGFAFVGSPVMNIAASALSYPCGGYISAPGNSAIDLTQTGPEVFGQGPGNTQLIPLPNFNYAGCTNGQSGHACIAATPNLEAHDFGVNGLGQVSISGNPALSLFELDGSAAGGVCTGSTGFNLSLANWGLLDANSIGFDVGREACGDATYFNVVAELFGAETCFVTSAGTVININGLACFGADTTNGALNIALSANTVTGQAGVVTTTGGYFAEQIGIGQVVQVTGGGIWNSNGEFFSCTYTTACGGLKTLCTTACNINLYSPSLGVNPSVAGGQLVWVDSANTQVHVRGGSLNATGANGRLLVTSSATGIFYDDCGNTFINGSTANSLTANTVIQCTQGVGAPATGNFALTNATFSSVSGADQRHVLLNLTASASAAITIVYTFPTPFPFVAPVCGAQDVGGTNPLLSFSNSAGPSTTAVTFLSSAAAVNTDTISVKVDCY